MRRLRWGPVAFALGATSLLSTPAAVQAQSSPTSNVHVVQPGDTLSQIALDAGVDPGAIASLNGLDDTNALSVGESLKLPGGTAATASGPSQSGSTYTVAAGDTLWSIAQRLNVSGDALVQANNLQDPNHLVTGSALSVPTGAAQTSAPAPASSPAATATPTPAPAASSAPAVSSAPAPAGSHTVTVSYTVQSGETLSGIAHQFSVGADAIAQASGLDDPNKLVAGTVVKVPVAARQHVVSGGETLRDIAASEKVDLGSLIDFNQIDDPQLIHVGQVLLLPQPASGQQAASINVAAAAPSSPTPASANATATPKTSSSGSGATAPTPASASTPAPAPASPRPTPSPSATPTPGAKAASASPSAAPAPRAPVAVVSPPPGAPTDGLAGAGLKLLGSAYVWGGSSPSTGFDCSGFVWYLGQQLGKSLSRSLMGQYNAGSHPARDQLQVGDLVFFQNTYHPGLSHNGIFIGNGQFVHAADEAAGVTISSLSTPYWTSHWFGATRLP